MPRPRWSKALLRSVYARASGHCHHCGVALPWDTPRTWHVDHHPVRYADIEDQVCVGVTDPRDESNLVASCAACCAPRKLDVDVGAAWVSSASMCSRAKVGSLTSQNVSGKLLQKNGWMM